MKTGAVNEAELLKIEHEVELEIDEAYEFAKASPEADPATVTHFVYA